ncbi:leucyl/phenylalanyl-tRNA--protein transferase [Gilvimarinus polysaccharolyticus]|uniref:leucyl/phenylalanyl-tRNA--protein transferase n=1 Tax=Gilvimarinus polysaccharolyticus TaxID=863921 RepID=UPI000A039A20|nr:leucyl/phenylalanyl-tRNA--protein transferase [Gilvimarinus polysaccharolyticus]
MIQLPWLEPDTLDFPPLDTALTDPDGLLAVGGDLRPERLIHAYCQGVFPWFDDEQPILWWSPNPRSVVEPANVHVSRSMAKALRKTQFHVTCDTAFEQVVRQCAAPRAQAAGTWITDDMLEAYSQLHERGVAHSIEVWNGELLVGGLYGLALGRVFFGESMFARATDASKIGFITLASYLQAWGFELIDCQVSSAHINSLGAFELPRNAFAKRLQQLTDPSGASYWPPNTSLLEIPRSSLGQTNSAISSRVNNTIANKA